MRAYKIVPVRAHAPVAYLLGMEGVKPLDAALAEFTSTYGFDEHRTLRDLRRRNQAQVNLTREASFLGLEHNPLYHELSQVFVDWAKKRFGYQEVDPNDMGGEITVELKFPY